MVIVVVMEQVSLGEWNERSRKENGQDAADGMKQEVYSKDRVMHFGKRAICDFKRGDADGRVMVMMDEERVRPGG